MPGTKCQCGSELMKAAEAPSQVDLSQTKTGIHGKIFSNGQPIFGERTSGLIKFTVQDRR